MKKLPSPTITWGLTCAFMLSTASAELILHYPIDAATVSVNLVEDISATQENDGFRSGGGTLPLVADRFGVANQAAMFVGNQGIAVDNANGASTSGSGAFTVAGWYMGTDVGYFFDQASIRLVLSVEQNSNQDPNDGGAAAGLGVFYNGTWYNSGVTNANDGDWHHLAFVLDNNSNDSIMSIYLDGMAQDVDPAAAGLQTTRTLTGKGIANLTQQTPDNFRQRFGSQNAGTSAGLVGAHDDLRIYDTALSAAQINALVIPEPSALSLIALGLIGLVAWRRRM